MSTNYYLVTKDKDWVERYFGGHPEDNPYWNEYESLYEETPYTSDNGYPLFAHVYEVHLSKQSYGWEPLLQWHPDAYQSVDEMEDFLHREMDHFSLIDEYGEVIGIDDYIAKLRFRQTDESMDHTLSRHNDGKTIHDSNGFSFMSTPFS